MQLTPICNSLHNRKDKTNQPSFSNGGAILAALAKPLQSFDANPIQGVIFLDILSAIAPNTAIDTVQRNPDQGFETFRRESSGLIVNCILPGLVVPIVAYMSKRGIVGGAFSSIASHRIWASKDNIDAATATWKNVASTEPKEDRYKKFIEEVIDKVQANSQSKLALDRTDAETQDRIKIAKNKYLKAMMDSDEKKITIPAKTLNEISSELSIAYGESKAVTIKGSTKTYTTSFKNYIRDHFALAKAFSDKSITPHNIDAFSANLKKLLVFKSGVTMLAIGALALSMQAINRKITEKMTGRKGYSGYKDLSLEAQPTKEEKQKLNIGKLISTAWFSSLAFVSMGKFSSGMLNFAAPTTTMNQARSLSLLTDVGRVGAADDKNELKDTTMRDTVIFMNLYVLGDYIQKGVVELTQKIYKDRHGINLNLMNEAKRPEKNDSLIKKIGYWIKGKSVKSFEEIEGTATKELSSKTQIRKNIITAANLTGIGYSLIALGIFVPLLIAKITNKNRQKQIAQVKAPAEIDINPKTKVLKN